MSRIVKFLLAINLLVLTILVFVYPNLMVGPGKLIPGHKQLETDCFACHSSFTGASSARCVICHKGGGFCVEGELALFHTDGEDRQALDLM